MENLELLVQFCLESYFKLFFDIKVRDRFEDGPTHLLTQLRVLRTLPEPVKDIVLPYIRLGAWFSHSENVLLSLLCSTSKEEREFAVNQILKLRGEAEFGDIAVRPRRNPQINVAATNLFELISWDKILIEEPVFTCPLSRSEVKSLTDSPLCVPHVKIHTQSTERAVKCVTEAAKAVAGAQERDGFIRARLHHREALPVFKNKRDILKLFVD